MTHSENASGGIASPAKFAARLYIFRIIFTRSGSKELRLSSEASWLDDLPGTAMSDTLFDGVCSGDLDEYDLSYIGKQTWGI
jgi:hypothetical protein